MSRSFVAAFFYLRRHATLCLFWFCLGLIALIYLRGQSLGMHRQVSQRYIYSAIPSVVSATYHDGTQYATFSDIQQYCYDSQFNFTNATIATIIKTPLASRKENQVFPADDKGLVDYVYCAFFLFGPKIEALYRTAILILLIGVVFFFLYYRGRPDRCLIPAFVLCAIYMVMPAFLLTGELANLTQPRLVAILGLIPALNVLLAIYDRHAFTWGRIFCLLPQAFLLTEAFHVRSSSLWLVLCPIAWLLFPLARQLPGFLFRHRDKSVLLSRLGGAWVVGLLLAGFMLLKVYQASAYPRTYRTEYLEHHLTWHNIAIGFFLHPKFADEFHLRGDDADIRDIIKKRVKARGDEKRYLEIFSDHELDYRDGIAVNYSAYEEEAKALVKEMVFEQPGATMELFLYYKPRVALRTFLWTANLFPSDMRRLGLHCQPSLLDRKIVAARRLNVRLFDPVVLLGLPLFCLLCLPSIRVLSEYWRVALSVLLCSMIPAMLTYPLIHLVGDCLIAVWFFVLMSGALVVSQLAASCWRFSQRGRASTTAAGQNEDFDLRSAA